MIEPGDAFAVGASGERQVAEVERFVGRPPACRAREHRRRFDVTALEVQEAAERPQVKGAPARGARARREAQVPHRATDVAERLANASCVLVSHVSQNLEPDELNGNLERPREPPPLVMGEVKLAQEHRLGGPVDGARRR